MADRKLASEHIAAKNLAAAAALPRSDEDFEEASRGLVAPFEPARIENEDGRTVWELETYDFLESEPPGDGQPEPVAAGQLARTHGLFEVHRGIYQVRGFDLSNMTLVEGDAGVDRHRPADLHRGRRGGAGARTASTAATGR